MHVIEKLSPSAEVVIGLYIDEAQISKLRKEKKEEQIRRIKERLNKFSKRELQDDPETLKHVASILVVEGDPAAEILQKVDELDCDIVIMGTYGHGLIGHAFLGSVAEKVYCTGLPSQFSSFPFPGVI